MEGALWVMLRESTRRFTKHAVSALAVSTWHDQCALELQARIALNTAMMCRLQLQKGQTI